MGFFDALATVEKEREAEIPAHLRDPNRDKEGFGHGAGYIYPHAYRDHWVEQQYLPTSLQGQVFYRPSTQGYEGAMQVRVDRLREAQLAALIEGIGDHVPERLTLSPTDNRTDQWLQRTIGQSGTRLGELRDRMFSAIQLQRHHVVLDLNARSGLLTWEALRQVPEGGVYSCVNHDAELQALVEQTQALPELLRPVILKTDPIALSQHLPDDLRFDFILGRNVLMAADDKAAVLQTIARYLQPQGTIVLTEAYPKQAQRLYALLPDRALTPALLKKVQRAEEAIYTAEHDPKTNWDQSDLARIFASAQLQSELTLTIDRLSLLITPGMLDRWFDRSSDQSYINRLAATLTPKEQDQVESVFRRVLNQQTVAWQQSHILIGATKITTSAV
jgi:putative ATPase